MAIYTQSNIEFSNVKKSSIPLSTGPLTIGNQIGPSRFGGIINAVDIDWNHGYIQSINEYIDTTGDLLSKINNIYNQLSELNENNSNYVTFNYLEKNYVKSSAVDEINLTLSQKANLSDLPKNVSDLQGYSSLATIAWVNNQLRYYSRSAYDVYVENGGTLSQADWLQSLHGENGANGLSAYELALLYNQTTLSESEWVKSLKGEKGDKGDKGDPGASINIIGYYDTLEELKEATIDTINSLGDAYNVGGKFYVYNDEYTSIDDKWKPAGSLQGPTGKSAYEIAVDNGFTGTEEEWLQSLKGTQGLSAYEIAKSFDNTIGTEEEWLQSIKGENGLQGKSAYDVYVEIQQALNKPYLSPEEWAANLENKSITYTAGDGILISDDNIISINKWALI